MRGLVNLGSTCYLNCIIQALSVLDLKLPDLPFFKHINGLFAELNTTGRPSSAYSVLQALNCPKTQQDAQEALIKVIDRIEEDTKELFLWISHFFLGCSEFQNEFQIIDCTSQTISISLNVKKSRAVRLSKKACKLINVYTIQLPQNQFTGTTLSLMKCTNCNRSRSNLSKTHIFQLNLPESLNLTIEEMASQVTDAKRPRIGFSLIELFENYTKEEMVESVYCDYCTIQDTLVHIDGLIKKSKNPKELIAKRTAILEYPSTANIDDIDGIENSQWIRNGYLHCRRMSIGYLPKFLIIQCMRSQYTSYGEQKNSTFVFFPFELNASELSPFIFGNCISKESKCMLNQKYMLRSVVEHQGIHNYGHYISYKYSELDSQWYLVSDEQVNKVDKDTVQRSEAYLLIYDLT
eukprot:NODE_381_length_9671_cov_0.208838.p3 type:complete len:407 gc:universal NODE_381_length_9671_cov_0.208838:2260-3480(+)